MRLIRILLDTVGQLRIRGHHFLRQIPLAAKKLRARDQPGRDYILVFEKDPRLRLAFQTRGEGGVFLEDKDVITTWLVSSANFLDSKRDLTKKMAAANAELTDWIQKNPDEAQKLLIEELTAETKTSFAPEEVAPAWKRINFTTAVPNELIAKADAGWKRRRFFQRQYRHVQAN